MATTRKGGALLAVLWVSAALSAIAFSVATTVRGEVERSGTAADSVKSYFLARGALERALLWVQWGDQFRNPDGSVRYWGPGMRRLHFEFPNGAADVEFLPENGKLNVNTAKPEELLRLLLALGVEPDRAAVIASGIVDWRSPVPDGASAFDAFYLAQTPSFRARHASLEEIEEILMVRGVTPELFHGTYVRDEEGRLQPRAGLKDCLSVFSGAGQVDVNTAQPAVLAAVGIPPDGIVGLTEMRRIAPFVSAEQLRLFAERLGPASGRLGVMVGSVTTLRATARLRLSDGRLSDLRRSVAAVVKFNPNTKDAYHHVLRWYDQGGLTVGNAQ